MIALSVEYSEVTETADKMLSSLNRLVVNATIIITVLLVVVCIILAIFSAWFNKNLGEKIKHLADFVGEMKTKDYSIDMPGGQAGSAELKDIADNMRQMVVALRFGHPKFAMGDKAKEFRNCIEALDIILQLDNKRGRGVCLNNMGLCLRALHTAHADATSTPKELTHHHYPQLAAVMQKIIPTYTAEAESVIDPDVFFRQSVHEAEVAAIPAAASAPAAGIGTVSATLATRLLNRAMYLITKTYITSKPKEQAMDCLEMVLKCDDIRVLTTVAWGATSDLQQALLSEEMRDTKELVLRICDRARALLAEKESSNGVDVELAQYFAELCAVRCFLDPSQTSQAARAWSALTTIPRMKEQHLKAFVYWVKLAAPSLTSELNDNLLQAGNVDVQGLEDKFPSSAVFGGADPMAAIFLVDRTWQPILDSTIDAVSMVFSDYINYHDRFGMYGLGDGTIRRLDSALGLKDFNQHR